MNEHTTGSPAPSDDEEAALAHTPDAEAAEGDDLSAPPWAKGHVKVKPQPLFSSFPFGTVAIMGVGLGLVGLGTIAVEIATDRLMSRHLPLPFLSAPLGVGAIVLGLIATRGRWHYGVGPALVALVYWGVFFYHAP